MTPSSSRGAGAPTWPAATPRPCSTASQRLASLPDDIAVLPGHRYSPASVASMAAVKEINYVFKPSTKEQWLAMFGGA